MILDFAAESFQLYVTRTFREDLEVEQQGCPVLLLRQDAVENLRWTRSGANFWVGGKGDGIRGFLSAHKGYDPEKNITRTMEDIGFCLMGPEEEGADVLHVLGNCHADHTASGNFAATVGRWPYGNSRPLRLAVTIAEQRLEYATGEPGGWPAGTAPAPAKSGRRTSGRCLSRSISPGAVYRRFRCCSGRSRGRTGTISVSCAGSISMQ